MSASSRLFSLPIRVYWEDTDAGGVVYHARYLHFLERARSEWLRTLGVVQSTWRDTHDLLFAVHSMRIEFRGPARMDDLLEVAVNGLKTGRASLEFEQTIHRAGERKELLNATIKVACLDASRFGPTPLPEQIKGLLGLAGCD